MRIVVFLFVFCLLPFVGQAQERFADLKAAVLDDTQPLDRRQAALQALRPLAEGGNTAQRLFLAGRLLDPDLAPDGRAEAIALLEPLAEAGEVAAQSLLGRALSTEEGQDARAETLLRAAMQAGDAPATRALVGQYLRVLRDRPEVLTPLREIARTQAETLSEAMLARIDAAVVADTFQSAMADLPVRGDAAGHAPVAAAFVALPHGPTRSRALVQLWRADRNAYTYVMQSLLDARGLYRGAQSGQMTARTIAAITAFCRVQGVAEDCRYGPLDGRAVRALAPHL